MPKAICPECSKENDKRMFKNPYFNQQLLEKDQLINELLEKVQILELKNKMLSVESKALAKTLQKYKVDPCPSCGCNELLCGHPKNCTSED